MKISAITKKPVPEKYSSVDKYPFREMDIGDHFTVEFSFNEDGIRAYDRVRAYTYQWQKRHGVKLITRLIDKKTVGIWRVG